MEKSAVWDKEVHNFNFKVHDKKYASRISPLLLSQVTFLSYLAIHYKAPLDAESVFDVIASLEDESSTKSTALLKCKIPFEEKGPYSGYEHSHVAVLPNAYLEMLKKASNQKRVVTHTSVEPTISIEFEKIDSEIMSKLPHKEGRMTGFWLVSRCIDNTNFYMGLFPHSKGIASKLTSKMHPDDIKICLQLQESERLLKHKNKRLNYSKFLIK